MIPRSKSFSKGGANIERVMQIEKYRIDPSQLSKMLKPRMKAQQTKLESSESDVPINGFDKVPGRQKPNSFLLHKVKDAYTQLNYEEKKDFVMPRTATLPVRKEKDQRLSLLMTESKKQAEEQSLRQTKRAMSCKKFTPSQNEIISNAGDLQNARKTFHHIDFDKQTSRPFDQTLRKISIQTENKMLTRSNSTNSITGGTRDSFAKTSKIHAFGSYTKREFLTENKVKGVPEVSGIDWYKINPQKFRNNWKTIQPPKFDTVAKKNLSRYDRDCPHWYTSLAYNVKNNDKSIKSNLNFQAQTFRKTNEVKSSYPIRLAI